MFIQSFAVVLTLLRLSAALAGDCNPLEVHHQELKKSAFQIQQSAMLENSQCVDLKTGESALVNQPLRGPILTSVPGQYSLKRVGDKSYQSEVAIHFYSHDSSVTQKEIEDFKIKVQKCLSSVTSLLKSSDGTSLEIRLSKTPEKTADGAVAVIALDRSVSREDSRHYGMGSSCPTIVHEILHLQGLVDEYKESAMKLSIDPISGKAAFTNDIDVHANLAFSCRHSGSASSVMSNPEMAFKEIELQRMDVWEYQACVPGPATGDDGCLPGYHLTKMGTFLLKEGTVPNGEEYRMKGLKNIKKVGQKIRKSLLGDGQFSAIIHPGCKENSLYYLCASNAYVIPIRAPMPEKSSGRSESTECQPTPPECLDSEAWTGLN